MPAYRFHVTLGPEHGHRQFETTTGPHPGPKTAEAHVRWQYPAAESIEPLGEEPAAEVEPLPGTHPDELPVIVTIEGTASCTACFVAADAGNIDGTYTLDRIPGTDAFTNTPQPETPADEGPDDRRDHDAEAEAHGGTGGGADAGSNGTEG